MFLLLVWSLFPTALGKIDTWRAAHSHHAVLTSSGFARDEQAHQESRDGRRLLMRREAKQQATLVPEDDVEQLNANFSADAFTGSTENAETESSSSEAPGSHFTDGGGDDMIPDVPDQDAAEASQVKDSGSPVPSEDAEAPRTSASAAAAAPMTTAAAAPTSAANTSATTSQPNNASQNELPGKTLPDEVKSDDGTVFEVYPLPDAEAAASTNVTGVQASSAGVASGNASTAVVAGNEAMATNTSYSAAARMQSLTNQSLDRTPVSSGRRAMCSSMRCGPSQVARPDEEGIRCAGLVCDGIEDMMNCCRERATCNSMLECPKGWKAKLDSDDALCLDASCTNADRETCCEVDEQLFFQQQYYLGPIIMVIICVYLVFLRRGNILAGLFNRRMPASLGIIQLDRQFTTEQGDLCYLGTFAAAAPRKFVKGLTWNMCKTGHLPPDVKTDFEQQVRILTKGHVSAIAADSGLCLSFSSVARQCSDKPVLMSALMAVEAIAGACAGADGKVAILTADAEALMTMADAAKKELNVDITQSNRFTIVGCESNHALPTYVNTGSAEASFSEVLMSKLQKAVEEDKQIQAVLIESPELRRYAMQVRAGLKLPVFDIATCAALFLQGSTDSAYKGKTGLGSKLEPGKSSQAGEPPKLEDGTAGRAPKLGILRTNADYEPRVGDVNNSDSFGYDVAYAGIPGLTEEMCRSGEISAEIEEALKLSVGDLEAQGATCIAGDVSSLAGLEPTLRKYTSAPLCMSSLAQLPLLINAFPASARVAIMTGNIKAFENVHGLVNQKYGIGLADQSRYVFVEVDDIAGFRTETEETQKADPGQVVAGVTGRIQQALKNEPGVRLILLEDTRLPAYSDAIRDSTLLPVFDAISCYNFFMNGQLDELSMGLNAQRK